MNELLEGVAYQLVAADGRTPLVAERQTDDQRWPSQARVPHVYRTLAGVAMTPDTAIQIASVWACIRYISQTIAVLPWRVQREVGNGAEIITTNPVDYLIHKRPSAEWSSFQFRETLAHWTLRWGNGYAEIERDALGRPMALWPIHPERVRVCRDPETRALTYLVYNGNGADMTVLASSNIFHLRGFGDGPVGVNVIDYAAQSLGWARAIQLHGASFFGNGANVNGVITKKGKFDAKALDRLKAEIDMIYRGPANANKVAYLDDETDWKAIGIDPDKAQMVEANQHLVEEVCRWFGVPPHKIAHLLRATFSNIEQQNIEVVQDCLMPWAKRFEDEADYKLFGQNRTNLHTKINLRGLLRGDFKSQQEGLQIMRNAGVINADEWRAFAEMNPMIAGAGGDKYTMQSQYTTLEQIGEDPATEQDAQDQLTQMAEAADAPA